jgi:hypothetical protein
MQGLVSKGNQVLGFLRLPPADGASVDQLGYDIRGAGVGYDRGRGWWSPTGKLQVVVSVEGSELRDMKYRVNFDVLGQLKAIGHVGNDLLDREGPNIFGK